MKTYIYIQADMNDADYTAELNEIQAEWIDDIQTVCKAIKNYKKLNPYKHNWPTGDCEGSQIEMYPELTEEQIELFCELCPYGENGIHSIVDVKILIVNEELNLFSKYDN